MCVCNVQCWYKRCSVPLLCVQCCHTVIHIFFVSSLFLPVEKCRAHENIIDKTIYKIVCWPSVSFLSQKCCTCQRFFRFQAHYLHEFDGEHDTERKGDKAHESKLANEEKSGMHRCNKHTLCSSTIVHHVCPWESMHFTLFHPLSFHNVHNFRHTMNSHSWK